LEVIVA
jgi:hypothetical protein